MMYLGDKAVGINTQFGFPSFFNHLSSGSFVVESGTSVTIQTTISNPSGILIFSNDLFDLSTDKADKQVLGSYAALYLKGDPEPSYWGSKQIISDFSFYFCNWGSAGSERYPAQRASRTENRGLRYFNTSTQEIEMNGFGTGDYDFKYNTPYHWIAWD